MTNLKCSTFGMGSLNLVCRIFPMYCILHCLIQFFYTPSEIPFYTLGFDWTVYVEATSSSTSSLQQARNKKINDRLDSFAEFEHYSYQ